MVKMVICSSDSPDKQRIKLEPEQASKAPFPPGCKVVVLGDSFNIQCSGEVVAAYVSFDIASGSCTNSYDIDYRDPKGQLQSLIAHAGQVRFGLDCPIYINPPSVNGNETNSLQGFIKGFELPSRDENDVLSNFLYTVEVSASIDDDLESVVRQRGVAHEFIRFRTLDNKPSNLLRDKQTTTVSFDEANESNNMNENCRPLAVNNENVTGSGIPLGLSKTRPLAPQINHSPMVPLVGSVLFSRCTPLKCPIPKFFQGDMVKCSKERVPDFITLTNLDPTAKLVNPEGMRCCLMCGQFRSMGPRGAAKNSTESSGSFVTIPSQNKGICTLCDVSVWVVNNSKMQIKWCKGCKNFQTWASFGEKGLATKCGDCREKQKEKYASMKKSSGVKRKAMETS